MGQRGGSARNSYYNAPEVALLRTNREHEFPIVTPGADGPQSNRELDTGARRRQQQHAVAPLQRDDHRVGARETW
jgi:hypothetical protein